MAEILIRNMEMPKGCYDCTLLNEDYDPYTCPIDQHCLGLVSDTKRSKKCQLVEIPKHGELIERDYIRKAFEVLFRNYLPEPQVREAYRIINNAPTVIPASKELCLETPAETPTQEPGAVTEAAPQTQFAAGPEDRPRDLRDEFAMAVLPSLKPGILSPYGVIAEIAYKTAEAMMKTRKHQWRLRPDEMHEDGVNE